MKKFIVLILLVLFITGCSDTKYIDGIEYDTYGLINEHEKRNPNIEYNLVIGNVVWAVLLCETIVAPIYFIGFDLYEPVGKKGVYVKGQVIR